MATLSGDQQENEFWHGAPSRHRPKARKTDATAADPQTGAGRISRLTRTIEAEIIPRLLLANSAAPRTCQTPFENSEILPVIIEELTSAVAHNDLGRAIEIVDMQRASGTNLPSIFLDLLAPTARHLGAAWDADTMNFAEVTVGLALLQQLLRELSPTFEARHSALPQGRRALLMTARGDQHSFGLFMVEVFFRRAGWDVVSGASLPSNSFANALRTEWVDVIAISKSCDDLLDELASDITTFRRVSRNRNLTVMVGGPAFDGHPERVTLVGADTTAGDAQQAVWQANKCVNAKRATEQV